MNMLPYFNEYTQINVKAFIGYYIRVYRTQDIIDMLNKLKNNKNKEDTEKYFYEGKNISVKLYDDDFIEAINNLKPIKYCWALTRNGFCAICTK